VEQLPTSTQPVLVVDDEPEIVSLVAYHLERAGYAVSTATDGAAAIVKARREQPRLIVLDVMLPGITGFEVLQAIRSRADTKAVPVLMLTALQEDEDRIRGLSLGVDDYVTKPFNPEELVLRVQAILRRVESQSGMPETITAGPIGLNLVSQRVVVHGQHVDLTRTEYRLLLLLAQQQGRVVERSQLLEDVWAAVPDMQTRTVDVHIQRLRSKLGAAGEMIETVRRLGYRLRLETAAST
jgi:two-component system, OmpR family, phosphate regulon response regulator PhoB